MEAVFLLAVVPSSSDREPDPPNATREVHNLS
jgi:hypothetical protein